MNKVVKFQKLKCVLIVEVKFGESECLYHFVHQYIFKYFTVR